VQALIGQSPGDHEMPLAGGEGVLERVRQLRAPYAHDQTVALLGDRLHHLQVPQVEGLEPSYEQGAYLLFPHMRSRVKSRS